MWVKIEFVSRGLGLWEAVDASQGWSPAASLIEPSHDVVLKATESCAAASNEVYRAPSSAGSNQQSAPAALCTWNVSTLYGSLHMQMKYTNAVRLLALLLLTGSLAQGAIAAAETCTCNLSAQCM
jgi:hypothetical protein